MAEDADQELATKAKYTQVFVARDAFARDRLSPLLGTMLGVLESGSWFVRKAVLSCLQVRARVAGSQQR